MANSKYNSSISIKNETREKLMKFRDENNLESYDQAINELMSAKQGYIKEYSIIHKKQVALTLYSKLFGKNNEIVFDEVDIFYDDLVSSDIGRKYCTRKPGSSNYSVEVATIIHKSDNFVLLKIDEEVCFGQIRRFTTLVGVELL